MGDDDRVARTSNAAQGVEAMAIMHGARCMTSHYRAIVKANRLNYYTWTTNHSDGSIGGHARLQMMLLM